MKFELDTTTKTIILKEGATVEELNEMVREMKFEGYKAAPVK